MFKPRKRLTAAIPAALALLVTTSAPALASHGGGGGGTTTTPPPPATAPAVSLPATVAYGPQDVGTASAPQTVTLTNIGTASLFINRIAQGGTNGLDFAEGNDFCIGNVVAPGASCTLQMSFTPTATGTRTATLSVLDNAPSSPQVVTFTGTGTSLNGPTPMTVDTTGLSCDAAACDLGIPGDALVKNFYFSSLSTLGQSAGPYVWNVAAGALPPGLAMVPSGQIYGTPTATGAFTFTARVTDANGQVATQPFRLTIAPQPPPLTSAQQGCQHAPGQTVAPLAGPAIGGVTPSGQANGDQSQLTACGGYTTITAQFKNVKVPNGTVLWPTLGGEPIGRVVVTNRTATMPAWITTQSLRQVSMLVYLAPPTGSATQAPILSGKFG